MIILIRNVKKKKNETNKLLFIFLFDFNFNFLNFILNDNLKNALNL